MRSVAPRLRRTRRGGGGTEERPFVRAATCRAPQSALHFTFYGTVTACCQNGEYTFGGIADQSLAEIWAGASRRAMVESLDRGEYPIGCELCAVEHGLGHRMSTPAQSFDRFSVEPTPWPGQLEFELSNRCNLACIHCNGENSSTIRRVREQREPMPRRYGDDFFDQLDPFLEHAEVVAFLGGEPFLMPEARRVWDRLLERGLHPEVQVTTNATVCNERVERYVRDLSMNLAISIDGATKETFEAVRVGARWEDVVANRDRLLELVRGHGGYVQLNHCLLRENWHELADFVLEADRLDVPANIIPVFRPDEHSVFALPLDELDEVARSLEEARAQRGPDMGRNRAAFEAAVAAVAQERDRVAEGWDGSVRLPMPGRRPAPGAIDVAVADLVAWAGREALVVEVAPDPVEDIRSVVVACAVVPDWARPLLPGAWVGSLLDGLFDLVADHLGPITPGEVRHVAPGIVFRESVIAAAQGPVHIGALFVESEGRLYVASPDLAAPAETAN